MPHSALTLSVALLPKPITRHCIDCSCLGIECRQHNTFITHRVLHSREGGYGQAYHGTAICLPVIKRETSHPARLLFMPALAPTRPPSSPVAGQFFFRQDESTRHCVEHGHCGILSPIYIYEMVCGNRKFSAKSRLCVTFSAFFSSHTGEPPLRLF